MTMDAQKVGPSFYQSTLKYGNYTRSELSMITSPVSPVFVQAPSEKGFGSFATNSLMFGVAVAVPTTAVAPIQRVNLLLQSQGEIIKAGRLYEPYKGIRDCFKRIIRDEGFGSLWRGNTASLIRIPSKALNLALYVNFKRIFNFKKEDGNWKCFAGNLATGGAAGASTLLFVYSLDYARTRLANDVKAAKILGGGRQFNGLIDVYKKTLASDGIAGLYRGFNISCVGVFVYRGLYFGTFDSLRAVLLTGDLQNNFSASLALSWLAATVGGVVAYPIDTVRRRMMMTSGEAVKYKSAFDAFSQILKYEGAKSLYNGAGAKILGRIAGNVVLVFYDKLQLIVFGKKYGCGLF